jgi:hypothetical protein
MAERKLPTAEKYASCPNDGNILDYYSGQFDTVFIAYHKFYLPKDIPLESFEGDLWPSNFEIRSKCTPIDWSTVVTELALKNEAELDVGLRTCIGGLKKQFENKKVAELINEYEERQNIFTPSEGGICPFIEGTILDVLQTLNYNWLWVGDEFCTEKKLKWIKDILSIDEIPSSANAYTPDKKLLISTHWDSHCTFICGSSALVNEVVGLAKLEGFYCNDKTHVYWGVHADE